jgi:acetyl esterase/lipase
MLTRRNLIKMGSAAAAFTVLTDFSFASAWAAGPDEAHDTMALVNPEFRPMLKMFTSTPHEPFTLANLAKQREAMAKWNPALLENPKVTEVMIPGGPGAPKVRVYVTGNEPGASKPAVLHIHGGGYIVGNAETQRRVIQQLALDHGCVAVTVDYRLAPETHFPGSLEDNYAALRWMNVNARELGVDVTRIAVKGESAGGGHAAALAIAARDRGEFPICLQVLIYPMLDDRTGSSRKMPPWIGRYMWTAEDNRFGWTCLLGVPAGSAKVPANSVPARVTDLRGLAPAFIGVGSIDLFAPEDVAYAKSLIEAGVPTELQVVPGGFHGFDLAEEASLTKQFKAAWNTALRREFEKS